LAECNFGLANTSDRFSEGDNSIGSDYPVLVQDKKQKTKAKVKQRKAKESNAKAKQQQHYNTNNTNQNIERDNREH
jgi:hypothetical protein